MESAGAISCTAARWVRSGLSSAALLAACGGTHAATAGTTSTTSTGPTGGAAVKGGTLRVGLVSAGSAETIDVRKALNFPDYVRLFNLLDPLFFAAPGGLVTPGLCQAAHPNKDATVWTLELRPGVEWQDGSPFTADDVIYTMQSWHTKESNIFSLADSIIDYSRLRKLNKLTVEVGLKHGVAQFPSTTFTQNSSVIKNGTTDFSKVIGTGPFKLESFTPGSQSVFTANPNYWGAPAPYVDTLIIDSSYANDTARLNALLAGDVDIVLTVAPALAKANAASGRIVLGNAPGPAFIAPTMIVTEPPFTDVRVRQAMRLLADRKALALEALAGYGTPGNDLPGQTLQFWASDFKRPHDPEQARSLLKAAGHENLSLTLYTSDIIPGMNETATLYAQQASAGGVNISVKVVDPSIYYSAASPGGTTWTRRSRSTTGPPRPARWRCSTSRRCTRTRRITRPTGPVLRRTSCCSTLSPTPMTPALSRSGTPYSKCSSTRAATSSPTTSTGSTPTPRK